MQLTVYLLTQPWHVSPLVYRPVCVCVFVCACVCVWVCVIRQQDYPSFSAMPWLASISIPVLRAGPLCTRSCPSSWNQQNLKRKNPQWSSSRSHQLWCFNKDRLFYGELLIDCITVRYWGVSITARCWRVSAWERAEPVLVRSWASSPEDMEV